MSIAGRHNDYPMIPKGKPAFEVREDATDYIRRHHLYVAEPPRIAADKRPSTLIKIMSLLYGGGYQRSHPVSK